ncbi:MAG: single-stranded DNA-binding protein, partial [Dissulfurimicrobium sp.]
MARGLNKVMLIGRLGADPEIRYTQDGTPVANLRLATNRAVKKGEQWEEETDWHRVIAWRRLAEICERYLNKGSLIYVE